jgi:hypothetical protein
MERICKHHGLVEFRRTGKKWYCPKCNVEAVSRQRRRNKETLVSEHGGGCNVCGYSRYLGNLHFHHRDPATKEFSVSFNRTIIAIDRLRAEAKKCVLLCHNCHGEVEAGMLDLGTLTPLSDEESKG